MPRPLFVAAGFTCYLALGAVAAAYLAGALYFVVNKSMPHDVGVDTWYRYWRAYAGDPAQHHRLAMSGVFAVLTVLAPPVAVLIAFAGNGRSLHGEARWATSAEIDKAGLL